MGDSTKKSFTAMLGTAKLPERTVEICLRGDLNAELAAADEALTKAQERSLDSLAGGGDTGALLERIEALQAEMAENTYPFRLRGLPRPKFRAILAEHPPRRIPSEDDPSELVVHPGDQYTGINGDTFHDALIRACLIDPPDLDDDGWQQLVDVLNDFQFDELASAAWALNRSDVDPFSRAALRMTRSTGSE
jgi:hypothetical protein